MALPTIEGRPPHPSTVKPGVGACWLDTRLGLKRPGCASSLVTIGDGWHMPKNVCPSLGHLLSSRVVIVIALHEPLVESATTISAVPVYGR
jgi:hypothetical protein